MKFTIRDLLLVTLIVALAVGWAIHAQSLKLSLARSEERLTMLKDLVEQEGYKVEFTKSMVGLELPNSSAPAPNPPKP